MSRSLNPREPPRLARRILGKALPADVRDDIANDLAEVFQRHCESQSPFRAEFWYWRETLTFSSRFLRERLSERRKVNRARRRLRPSWISRLGRPSLLDFKLGFRMMGRYPALSLLCVVVGSFGIASGAGTFAFMDNMFYPTLTLHEGDRVVAIETWDAEVNRAERQVVHDFVLWREECRSVVDLSLATFTVRNLSIDDGPASPLSGSEMSASGFRVTRVPPLLGRTLLEADEQEDAPAVVVIGYDVWQTRFGADPNIIGRTLQVAGSPNTVVGVMPQGFAFPLNQSFWTALRLSSHDYETRQGPAVLVFGRLAPGVTLEEAQAEITSIGIRIAADHPESHQHLRPVVKPYAESFLGRPDESILEINAVKLLGVMILLLTWCNVALLLFARAASRESEIAVRNALGASRGRITMQIFIEALVLACAAAAIGLVVADYGLRIWFHKFLAAGEWGLPFWMELSLSPKTILFALSLTSIGSVIAGVVPALKITRAVGASLQQIGAGSSSSVRFGPLWTTVVVVQIAVTVLCPALAFTLQQDIDLRKSSQLGFPEEEFLTARLEMDMATPSGRSNELNRERHLERFSVTIQELERRVKALRNVTGVTFADRLPSMWHQRVWVAVDQGAAPIPDAESGHRVYGASVDLEFFDVFGVPIIAGRGFHSTDMESDHGVAIVNESFVDSIFEGRNPLGRRLRSLRRQQSDGTLSPDDEPGPWYEIVGVVRNIGGGNTRMRGMFYLPMAPDTTYPVHMAIHVSGSATQFAGQLREMATALDPSLRLHRLLPLNELGEADMEADRFGLRLLILGSAVAVILSVAGIYSVLAFTVSRRTREIGIRVALGSGRRRLVTAILRQSLALVGIGISVGCALMIWAAHLESGGAPSGRALAQILALGAIMVGVCLLACIVPTRRALSIEPTEALRAE